MNETTRDWTHPPPAPDAPRDHHWRRRRRCGWWWWWWCADGGEKPVLIHIGYSWMAAASPGDRSPLCRSLLTGRECRHFSRQYFNTFPLAVFEATAVSLRGEKMQRHCGRSCNVSLNHAMAVFHRYFQGEIHFTYILLCNFTPLQSVVEIKELTQSPLFYHYFINFSFSAFMTLSDCRCEGVTWFKNVSEVPVLRAGGLLDRINVGFERTPQITDASVKMKISCQLSRQPIFTVAFWAKCQSVTGFKFLKISIYFFSEYFRQLVGQQKALNNYL